METKFNPDYRAEKLLEHDYEFFKKALSEKQNTTRKEAIKR